MALFYSCLVLSLGPAGKSPGNFSWWWETQDGKPHHASILQAFSGITYVAIPLAKLNWIIWPNPKSRGNPAFLMGGAAKVRIKECEELEPYTNGHLDRCWHVVWVGDHDLQVILCRQRQIPPPPPPPSMPLSQYFLFHGYQLCQVYRCLAIWVCLLLFGLLAILFWLFYIMQTINYLWDAS